MTLEAALAELVTTAQACGAWPKMREMQSQAEQGFRDTLLRFRRTSDARATAPYRRERARDLATMDRLKREIRELRLELQSLKHEDENARRDA